VSPDVTPDLTSDVTSDVTPAAPIPVVLDCDPGHDDAFAIMLAAADPGVDLRAITTVSGNGPIEKVTENARRIGTLLGLSGVPIAEGAGRPLHGEAAGATEIHGESALDGAELPAPAVPLSPLAAVPQMLALLSAGPHPVTVIATGPLTNVATLLRDHPEAAARIGQISLMGGSNTRGNWAPLAEFNIWADPEAARIVFDSGRPIRMVGLDVTHQVLATPAVLDALRKQDTPLAHICADLLLFFAEAYRTTFDMPDPPLHDPLAVLAVIHPEWFTWKRTNVVVETAGVYTRGATVVDLDGVTGRTANAEVAVAVDVERFWRLMLGAVAQLGAAAG
jgi:purine nucleosidase/pyrimidine-specific ribonucleoside hydrolase